MQTGVAEGAIEERRTGILRGRVLAEDGSPLAGVTVTVLDHPELGRTVSREGGGYDLAVNGGAAVVVDFHKDGYIDSQRTVDVGWQEYAAVEDVALVAYDAKVTEIDLGSDEPIQVARGTTRTDRDGSRTATMMFRQGTKARMQLPDGSERELDELHIRATEYTVGEHGDERMPAALPPTSAYTYAVELSADEAVAADATTIKFDKPVAFYVENFLEFNVGSAVPVGWYDRSRGVWVPEPNGRVVEVVSETGGLADVNLDRDPQADPDRYAEFGLTDAEREEVAALYEPGKTLWRVQLSHFSPIDCNWLGRRLGPDANPDPRDTPQPPVPDPDRDDPDPDDDCKRSGSIIGCENRTLGEMVAIQGTPYALHYESDRVPGRKSDRLLHIPVTPAELPEGLKRVEVRVSIAGRFESRTFEAEPNRTWLYEWDGKDAYGRPFNGSAHARVELRYTYSAYRQQEIDDAVAEAGVVRGELNMFAKMISPKLYQDLDKGLDDWISRTRELARVEATYTKSWEATVASDGEGRMGTWDARGAGLGGWTLDAHHTFDPASHLIYQGDGDRRSPVGIRQVLATVAGDGWCGDEGEGGPAEDARVCSPEKIAAAPDGSLFFTEGMVVRRIDAKGILTRYAGTGVCGGNVKDGTPRLEASLCYIDDLEVGPDGAVYITQRQHILRIDPNGAITRVAGGGRQWADVGKATAVEVCWATGLALSAQGGLYFVDREVGVVRYVGTDGQISTVAGKNPERCPVNQINAAAPATAADDPTTPEDLTVGTDVAEGPDGSLYVPDADFDQVFRLYPDGQVVHAAGRAFNAEPPAQDKDGIPALDAELALQGDLEVAADGSLYLLEQISSAVMRLRRVGPDGIVTTVAGVPPGGEGGEGSGKVATASEYESYGFALSPDGSIAIADAGHRIARVTSPLPGGLADRPVSIPSGDGSEVWQFTAEGRHLRTYDALTGTVKFEFGYDDAGLLTTVTGRHGEVTRIERGAGGRPLAIVAPGGQRTELGLDGNGWLNRIENPADEAFAATYTADGLMKSFAEPTGHEATLEYDEMGRLRRDAGPGGVKTLTSQDIPFGSRVTLRTGLGRTEVYEITERPNGDVVRKQIGPTGAETTVTARRDGRLHSTYPDGTEVTLEAGPDPRWGLLAPAIEKLTVKTPGGRTKVTTEKRRATFSSDDPVTGLATLTNEITINGKTRTRTYDAATRTLTDRTAAGRETSTTFNALGRVERWSPGQGLEPVTLTYDARGRVTDTVQGTRTEHLDYDERNRVIMKRDPLGKETRYTYDDADRLETTTLPSGRRLEFGHDGNGNRTHVKMPTGKVHALGNTHDDLVERYTPPGNGSYEWSYDADRALQQLKLPSGRTVTPAYDAANGRVTGETTPEAQTAFTYADATDRVDTITRTEAGSAEGLDFGYDSDMVTGMAMTGSAPGAYTFTYDNALQLTSAKLETPSGTVTTGLGRDDDGLLTQLGPFTLVRDLTGAVTDVKDGGATVVQFGHDTLARGTSRRVTVGGGEKYASELGYDAAGSPGDEDRARRRRGARLPVLLRRRRPAARGAGRRRRRARALRVRRQRQPAAAPARRRARAGRRVRRPGPAGEDRREGLRLRRRRLPDGARRRQLPLRRARRAAGRDRRRQGGPLRQRRPRPARRPHRRRADHALLLRRPRQPVPGHRLAQPLRRPDHVLLRRRGRAVRVPARRCAVLRRQRPGRHAARCDQRGGRRRQDAGLRQLRRRDGGQRPGVRAPGRLRRRPPRPADRAGALRLPRLRPGGGPLDGARPGVLLRRAVEPLRLRLQQPADAEGPDGPLVHRGRRLQRRRRRRQALLRRGGHVAVPGGRLRPRRLARSRHRRDGAAGLGDRGRGEGQVRTDRRRRQVQVRRVRAELQAEGRDRAVQDGARQARREREEAERRQGGALGHQVQSRRQARRPRLPRLAQLRRLTLGRRADRRRSSAGGPLRVD